jgi:hypothetical protein
MSDTKIVKCSCKHEYQDKQYGAGNRVANKTAATPAKYICTVCGKEH